MKLIEVVEQDHTCRWRLATVISFAKTLGKIPVIVGVCDGFVANRIMSAHRCEAEYLIEDGAMPWDVDNAMVEFGFPVEFSRWEIWPARYFLGYASKSPYSKP